MSKLHKALELAKYFQQKYYTLNYYPLNSDKVPDRLADMELDQLLVEEDLEEEE